MHKFFEKYCEKHGHDGNKVYFMLRGKEIDGNATLRSLKLSNFGQNVKRSTIHMYEDLRNRGIFTCSLFLFLFFISSSFFSRVSP